MKLHLVKPLQKKIENEIVSEISKFFLFIEALVWRCSVKNLI